MSDLSLLMDMGFSQPRAEKALSVTGNQGVEQAMEWLLAHEESIDTLPENPEAAASEAETEEPDDAPQVPTDEASINIDDLSEEIGLEAKSIKCDECNKKFRTDAEVEFHAVKSGHQSFSQSSDDIKPLSEEEKKEQVKKIESIIKQRRAEKAEQEKKEELEREKNRRKTGQELTHVRQKMQEQEMKELAESKRREKMEEKMARQKVLEQIERDKQARREKFGMAGPTPVQAPVVPIQEISASPPEVYDTCRLQIRLMNGSCLTHSFGSGEELAAVRLYIEMNRTDGTGPFALMTNFPKKVFTESDMNAPLSALGLAPSAVLIVTKPH